MAAATPHAGAPLAPTVADILLGNLRHNLRQLRQQAGPTPVMGVVKANAYGHGAVEVTQVLIEEGVSMLAVATVPEALALRAAGLDAPILVFAAPLPAYLPAYVTYGLDVTVSSVAGAEAVMAAVHGGGSLRAHVKVDTGMGRLGMTADEMAAVVPRLRAAPGVTVAGLWTHFAGASATDGTFAATQWARFEAALARVGVEEAWVHAASSSALYAVPQSVRAYGRMLIRAGIGLYCNFRAPHLARQANLKPVMRLASCITHLKTVSAGTPISYHGTWQAPQRTRIATVGAGYADGYPRLLSNRAQVGIGGRLYPAVGTICIDMFMVDLGPPDGPGEAVCVGDEVVLFGPGGPDVNDVAAWAETIPYELCCGISARVPRRYRP